MKWQVALCRSGKKFHQNLLKFPYVFLDWAIPILMAGQIGQCLLEQMNWPNPFG